MASGSFDSVPNVEFIEGLPQRENFDGTQSTLLILDDLMNETNRSVTDLFTKGRDHRDLSVVNIVQNLFNNGKEHRTISLNSHYIVVFKNPHDASKIVHLAKQAYPGKVKAVKEGFKDATSSPFDYLLLDFKQCTPDELRLRTKVFPGETTVVYVSCWEQWRHGWTATHGRSNFFPGRIKRCLKISLKVQVTTSSSVFAIARSTYWKEMCVSPKQKSKLKRHKKALRDLAKKKVSLKTWAADHSERWFSGNAVVSRYPCHCQFVDWFF